MQCVRLGHTLRRLGLPGMLNEINSGSVGLESETEVTDGQIGKMLRPGDLQLLVCNTESC